MAAHAPDKVDTRVEIYWMMFALILKQNNSGREDNRKVLYNESSTGTQLHSNKGKAGR